MLSVVTKDRERLGQRLATETEARKRLEAEKVDVEYALSMVRNLLMTSFEPNALGFLLEEAAERGANPTMVTRLQRHLQTVDFAEVSRKALEARLVAFPTFPGGVLSAGLAPVIGTHGSCVQVTLRWARSHRGRPLVGRFL